MFLSQQTKGSGVMRTALIKPEWSPLSIALMVVGFIVFWPLGLAMLAYILWGERFGGSAVKAQAYVDRGASWMKSFKQKTARESGYSSSGNEAFDGYRREQLQRLEEERRRLDDEVAEFHDYLRNLRRARDREEFDAFRRAREQGRRPEGEAGRADDHDTHEGTRQGY